MNEDVTGGMPLPVRRCAEPACAHLVRWVDRCPAHQTSTTPDRMPSRQELLDELSERTKDVH